MNYKTVFDISQHGYTTGWFPASGLIFVAIGALLVLKPDMMERLFPSKRRPLRERVFFRWSFFLFSVIWTTSAFAGTYSQYWRAETEFRNRDFSVVDGPVENFIPMPVTGHAMEYFMVGGQGFSYSDYVVTAGFHNTASHGGPIREGLNVRVTYNGNTILKLEVAQ